MTDPAIDLLIAHGYKYNTEARCWSKDAPVQSLQCAHCHVTIETLNDKVVYLIAEVLEQCRINGMSAEREDALAAENVRLNRVNAELVEALNEQQLAAVKLALKALLLEDMACRYEKEETPQHIAEAITALQSIISQDALDKMAENARELGLSYDDVPQPVPVKTYHDGKPWPVAPKPWVGLTDEEVSKIIDAVIGFNSCWGPEEDFARAIEAKLKEKNT
jgi:hypothetical protein